MLRTVLAALALAAVIVSPAAAQESERGELASEVTSLLGMETLLSGFFDSMSPMVASVMANDLDLTPVQTARLAELVAEEFRAATPAMVAEMSAVYAERMSETELRETVEFLRSPSGAAFLQTQIDAQGELERIGQLAGMRVGVQALTRLTQESRASQ
jgi:hypothetical protein